MQAFNTFIDDVFAFIITMPTAHRVAVFRDDIVFLVYLYQRRYAGTGHMTGSSAPACNCPAPCPTHLCRLYPVDKSRVNEFGETFDKTKDKQE